MNRRLHALRTRLEQSSLVKMQLHGGFSRHELARAAAYMQPLAIGTGPGGARARWQRMLAGFVALTLWIGPLQVTWQSATQAAALLGHGALPRLTFGLPQARAQVISDPSAPIRFQPKVSQSTGAGGGVPVVNITAPNANGISLNQYRQFNVDPIGLILNNSTIDGGALLGGNVAANPNLTAAGSRTASLILNQVTSQGSPSTIGGSIEVFGQRADVVIANPNGITCTGCGFVNTSRITLTTGVPQFLDAPGGAPSSFDSAAALAYNVQSGRIQIEGPAGANGQPGAGIEGTVGSINLIGETVGINAPLYAGQQINVIAGRQLVGDAVAGQGRAGSDYSLTSNGLNTAASSASAAASANPTLQIDATAFGAMTAGQIKIIGTTDGLGVRTDGSLAASTNSLSIDANGNVRTGATYGKQGVDIRSTGSVTAGGDGLGEGGYSVNAGADINLGGSLQSGQNLLLQAGRSINGSGSATGGNSVLMQAGGSIDIGGALQAGNVLALQAQGNDGKGDIRLGGSVSAPNQTAIVAARDITIDGDIASGSDLALAAQRNLSINGTAGAIGDLTLAGITGSVNTTGQVATLGALAVNARTDANLGGQVYAGADATLVSQTGNVTVSGALAAQNALMVNAVGNATLGGATQAGGDIAVTAGSGDVVIDGDLATQGKATVNAGRNIAGSGNASISGDVALTAGQDIGISGNVEAGGNLQATAGRNLAVGQTTVIGNADLRATQGNVVLNGQTLTGGSLSARANTNLTIGGSATSLANLTLTAQTGSLTVGGDVNAKGTLNAQAGQTLALNGATVSNADATLSARNITTAGSTTIGGNLTATAQNGLNLSGGTLVSVGNAILSGSDIQLGSSLVGGNLTATAGNSLTTSGQGTVQGTAQFSGANIFTNLGSWAAAGNLSVSGGSVTNQSNAQLLSLATTTVNATNLINAGTIYGNTLNVSVSNSVTNNSGVLMGKDALNVSATTLAGNQNGLLFAGDPNAAAGAAPSGNVTLTVSGGNGSFNNTGGQILAGNNLTLNLPNQAFDPASAANGTLNLNGTLSINAKSVNVSGTWNAPGNGLAISTTDSISNTGSISKAGTISMSTQGALTNSGIITGGDVALAGTITNQAGGVIHAERDVSLSGNIVNAGVVEALRDINISGGDYDNRNAKTQANRDININIGGTLQNSAGTLAAVRNIGITAGTVNNDRAAPVDAVYIQAKISSDALLGSTVIGTESVYNPCLARTQGDCSYGGYVLQQATLATLSPNFANGTVLAVLAPERISDYSDTGYHYENVWHFYGATSPPPSGFFGYVYPTQTLALPTVDRIVQGQTHGQVGVITAGGDLGITTTLLSNRGGNITAGGNTTLNVGALDNGLSATILASSVQDSVNKAELSAFMTRLVGMGTIAVGAPGNYSSCDSCTAPLPPNLLNATTSVVAPTSGSQTYELGLRGQITTGGNLSLNGSDNLTNAGDITAAGNITVTTPGTFTNQGSYTSSQASTPGCVPGAATCREANPHVDSFSYQLDPNTMAAGGTLSISAGAIQNNFGTLAARGNVALAAGSVTNLAGAIQSTNADVIINAGQVINKVADPVSLHQSYGNLNPSFAPGCNPGGTYKESQCAADVGTATSPAAVISGARDITLSAGSLTNRGGLITAGRNATIDISGAIDNTSVALNTPWHGHWVEETCWYCDDERHETWGTVTTGSQESGIQAGNLLTVKSGGAIQNTGNLFGNTVNLSGTVLLNGYTNPQQPTPPATASRQVIPLGPPALPAQAGTAQSAAAQGTTAIPQIAVVAAVPAIPAPVAVAAKTVEAAAPVDTGSGEFHFTAPLPSGQSTVAAPSASAQAPQYVVTSPASNVLGGIGAATLVANLPDSLKPATSVPFYYDPFTENQQLQQAALAQTGRDTFLNGLTYDNQLSIDDLQKAILYQNAIAYAEANNVKLGHALTDQQIAALDRPLLWYVEETVPDPHCTLQSNACPGIAVLMPQLYLPNADIMGKLTGGTIAGNEVNLNLAERILNTGTVSANTLAVHTAELNNTQRSVDIGKSTYKVEGGWIEYTGTQLAPGGFMSAVNLDVQANTVQAIGDAFKKFNADGSVNAAGTQALLDDLKAKLGAGYTQSAAADDIHTNFIKEETGLGAVGSMVVMVAIAIATSGAGATLFTAAPGTLAAAVSNAAVSSVISSVVVGGINGNLTVEGVLKGAATSALTAGLTNGITYNGADGFGTLGWSDKLADASTLSNLAGTSTIGNGIVKAVTGGGAENLGTQVLALAGTSAVTAGVSTIVNGGSFKEALTNSLVNNAAAVGAYAIGDNFLGNSLWDGAGGILHVTSHALLGCAAAALKDGDCASGAIGGAVSAAITPSLISLAQGGSIDAQFNGLSSGQTAVVTALSMLAGSAVASAMGKDAVVAAGAAQNEALNNAIVHSTQIAKLRQQCGNSTSDACTLVRKIDGTQAVLTDQTKGPWKIVAQVDTNGTVVAYSAYNTTSKSVDYVLDPQDLSRFMNSNTAVSILASGSAYLSNMTPKYQQQAVSGAVDTAAGIVNGNPGLIRQGLSDGVQGWTGAGKDPGWWFQSAAGVTGGVLGLAESSTARTGVGAAESQISYPNGLAYRSDLPGHLAGPDGFTTSGQLSGTHNLQNATTALDTQGATYNLIPTGTSGISELKYSYTNAAGKTVTGSKTVYDSAVYRDKTMMDMSQAVGQRGYELYLQNTSQRIFDLNQGGVNFRVYINIDPKTGMPFVGNVHPIK